VPRAASGRVEELSRAAINCVEEGSVRQWASAGELLETTWNRARNVIRYSVNYKTLYSCYIIQCTSFGPYKHSVFMYRAADKSLARPGRKQATATRNFNFHISYS
jgi:hypothetical protein